MNGLLKSSKPVGQPTTLINPKVGNKKVTPVNSTMPANRDTLPTHNALPVNTTVTDAPQSSTPKGLLGDRGGPQVGGPVVRPELANLSGGGGGGTTNQATTATTSISPTNNAVGGTRMTATSTPENYPDRPGTNVEVDSGTIAQPTPGQGDYEGVNRPDVEQHELRDNASVAEQLKGLLAEDSPYIKQAELRAAQEAASRGLRNSTMGVQAGQQAAIAQALPIAQQDAQQNFQLQQNEQLQGYQMDQTLYNALLTGERDAVMQQYGLDQAQYNAALQQAQMRNQQGFELDRLEYQTQLQSVLNNEQHQQTLERMDVDQRNQLETINQQFVNQMEAMGVEMEHQARMAYTQSSTMIMQSAMEQLGFIYSNPEMSPEQQANAVSTVMNQLQQQLNFTSTLFEPFPGLDFTQPSAPQPPNGSGNNSGGNNTLPAGGYTPPSTGGQQQRVVSGGGAISDGRWDNQAQR